MEHKLIIQSYVRAKKNVNCTAKNLILTVDTIFKYQNAPNFSQQIRRCGSIVAKK